MSIQLGENHETPTKDINGPNELINHLSSFKPYLPDEAFAVFCDLTIDYLDDFPVERATNLATNELVPSDTSELELRYVYKNEALTDEAIKSITDGRVKDAAHERIEDEFKACGMQIDSEALKEALQLIDSKLQGISLTLKDKQDLYATMLKEFGGNTENIASVTMTRMIKALGRLSSDILESDPIPTIKQDGLFRKNQAKKTLEMWEKSKLHLIKKNSPPSREEILRDIINSASASYQRAIYGDRPIILTLGLDSDNTEQIDDFQREYYEKLGGYRIALTPEEWAEEIVASFVDELLYDETSQICKLLDGSVMGNDYAKQTRQSRRNYSRSGAFHSDKKDPRSKESTYEDKETVNGRIAHEKTKEKPAEFMEGLSGPLIDTQNDIARLLDAGLPNLGVKGRNKALAICNKYLQSSGDRIEPELYGTPMLKRKIIKYMITQLHPDLEHGDEMLCKEITQLFNSLKR